MKLKLVYHQERVITLPYFLEVEGIKSINIDLFQTAGRPDLQCTCGLDPKQTSPSFHQTAGLPSHLQVFHVDLPTIPSFRNPAVPPNFKFAWCIYSSCPVHPLGGILPYSPSSVPSGVPPPLQPIGQELYQPAGPASLAFQPVGLFLIHYNGQRDFKQVGLFGHHEAGPLSNLEKFGSPFVKATSETPTHEADQSREGNSIVFFVTFSHKY